MPPRAMPGNKPRSGARPSPLAPEDARLWERVTGDVAPLRRRAAPPEPAPREPRPEPKPARAPAPPAPESAHAAPRPRPLPELAPDRPAGLDRATAQRLRRGELAIEARLDLHGHTQEEAHRALIAFVEAAWRRGARCLLVITGKGGGTGGVLRTAFPRWLNGEELRGRVLAVAGARPQHGGAGAFYVLLRRQRRGAP